MTQYLSGEQRQALEAQELAAAEAALNPQADTQQQQQQQPDTVNWEQRYRDLQSHSSKQVAELKSKLPAQDFETENEKLQRQVAELHLDLAARNVADDVRDAQAAVGQAHPDFVAVVGSVAFAEWIKVQPEVFYKAIYDDVPNAELAIRALSLFKLETQQHQPRQQQQPDPASMQQRQGMRDAPQELNGPKVWTMSEIKSLNPTQYAQHEAEIDKAFAEGRIRN